MCSTPSDRRAIPRRRIALPLLVALTIAGGARAQDAPPPMDSQHFVGQPAHHGWFTTMSARSLDRWQPAGGLWLSYARIPLATYTSAGLNEVVVRELMTMQLDGAIGFGFADLAIGVPIHLRVAGDGRADWGGPFEATAIGDITLTPRATFLDPSVRGFGIGLAAPVTLPSGDAASYVGRDGVAFTPTLLITGHLGPVRLGGNVGYQIGRQREVLGEPVGGGLVYRGAVGVSPHRVIEIGGEVFGSYAPGATRGPLEWLAGARVQPVEGLALSVGGGSGIGRGVGAPYWRLVFGVSVAPVKKADRDDDGVVDRKDACPDQPEDLDGVDDADGCPELEGRQVSGRFEPGGWIDAPHPYCHRELSPDGTIELRLPPGVDSITVGADGYTPQRVELPAGDAPVELPPIVLVALPDTGRLSVRVGGPPATAVTLTGEPAIEPRWIGERAEAEVPAGPLTLRAGAPGFHDAQVDVEVEPATITFVSLRLDPQERPALDARIFFETGSSALDDDDRATLSELAAALIAAPAAGAVAVVGMADPRGTADDNTTLARARADAVTAALIESGVAADRLHPQTDRPDPDITEELYADARRVQFRWLASGPAEE